MKSDVMLARKAFHLKEVPKKALLRISASSKYELFINGKAINQGPARSAPHHQSYDILNISSLLQQGKNNISVKVHYQRGKISYHLQGRAGLLVQLNYHNNTILFSDNTWKVSLDPSWDNNSKHMSRFQLVVNDNVDLTKKIKNWNQTNYKDTSWSNALPLLRNSGWPAQKKTEKATHLTTPWTNLIPRDIPFLIEKNSSPTRIIEAKRIDPYSSPIKLDGKIDKQLLKAFNKGNPLVLEKVVKKNHGFFYLILEKLKMVWQN